MMGSGFNIFLVFTFKMADLPISSILLIIIMGLIGFVIFRLDCQRDREMSWNLDNTKAKNNIKRHFYFDTDTETETASSMISEFSDFSEVEYSD